MPSIRSAEIARLSLLAAVVLGGAVSACAGVHPHSTDQATGGSVGTGSSAGAGGARGTGRGGAPGTVSPPPPTGDASVAMDAPPPITDFPPTPVIGDPKVPANAPTLFGGTPRTSGAPCVSAPEPNTLMPRNWLRPQFQYAPGSGENLFQIQLSTAAFASTYTIYTTKTTYTLDPMLWNQLRISVNDQPINVSITAMTVTGSGTAQLAPSPPAHSSFTIAPVDAPGKIVYWALPNGGADGILRGFGIGEEGVEDVLTGPQVQPPASSVALNDGCVGCHTSTPDGKAVGFAFGAHNTSSDTYFDTIVDIEPTTLGYAPSFVDPAQLTAIRTMRGIPAYSTNHWSTGDHIVLLMDGQNHGDLDWVQLDAAGQQGTLARTGDTNGATEPTFSHDGKTIVYVSTTAIVDGRLANGPTDLCSVPYNDRTGGSSVKVTGTPGNPCNPAGATSPANTNYYPAFSPDDRYLTFTHVTGGQTAYSNNQAEVFVVDAAGATAPTRFAANNPPACQTSQHSPGVTNDWSKWAPEASAAANGNTYYWVTFSSTRNGPTQLFVAPMTVKAGVVDVAYPALYLWNQPSTDKNHTPSWDDYQIPPIMIGSIRPGPFPLSPRYGQ
jgi:WD40-like Beta Propeller Repeat